MSHICYSATILVDPKQIFVYKTAKMETHFASLFKWNRESKVIMHNIDRLMHIYMLHSHFANYVRCHPVLDKCDMIQDCQWSESYFGTKSCLSYDNCKKSSDKLENCRLYHIPTIFLKMPSLK